VLELVTLALLGAVIPLVFVLQIQTNEAPIVNKTRNRRPL
jgi:hypothetical protein